MGLRMAEPYPRATAPTFVAAAANSIHDNRDAVKRASVNLNGAGLEREFLETELFGHGKGAFTG